MTLENKIFKHNFHYRVKFINRCIFKIQYMKCEKRRKAYKSYVFRMMKDIVKKNTCNYINLLTKANIRDIPDKDELIADCYIMFDKCLEKYRVSSTSNFYFYYNKSISRNLFRNYQKLVECNSVELTPSMLVANSKFHDNRQPDTIDILIENLKFDDIEKKIIQSRLIGQKTSEFLDQNQNINNFQYSRSLKKIKEILKFNVKIGEL